jgi:hypothetical protein
MQRFNDRGDFAEKQYIDSELARMKQNVKPVSPVTAFTVTPNTGGAWGATLNWTLGSKIAGIDSLRVLRNTTQDITSAKVLTTYPLSVLDTGRQFQYIDADKTLVVNQYYWIETIPMASRPSQQTKQSKVGVQPIYAGPVPLTALNASLVPPDPIPAFAVSLSARTNSPSGPIQHVYVNFQKPADPSFASIQIRATGYEGSAVTTAIAQSLVNPFTFDMVSLGETVTLYATAISQNGIAAATSPSVVVNTNGVKTVPAAIENLSALQIIGGNQISWAAGLEPDNTNYKLYRNTVNTFGTATLIHTFTPSFPNVFTYTDSGGTVNSYYWVTVTNSVGTSTQSNTASVPIIPTSIDQLADGVYIKSPQFPGGEIVVDNGNFEDDPGGTILPVVPGWNSLNATLSYLTASPSPQSGTQSLKVQASAQFGAAISTKKWRCTPVEQYKIAGWVLSDGVSTPVIQINFIDKNGGFLSSISASNGTNATWTFQTGTGTVPANAVYFYISLQNNTAGGTGAAYFDNIFAVRVRSTDDELFDGPTTFRNQYITIPTNESNAIVNGSFQEFPLSQTVANKWTKDFETSGSGFTYSRGTTSPFIGTVYQSIQNNGASGGTSIASQPMSVKQNGSYIFECRARSTVANPGTLYVRALFYSDSTAFTRSSGNLIGFQDVTAAGGPTSANVWQSFSGLIVAPNGAKWVILALYNWVGTSNRMDFATASSFLSNLSPANGAIDATGTIPPSGATALTYSNTASSITWSWSGLSIYRADLTVTNVPNGNTAITGLSASTTYYFYPYYDDLTHAVTFVSGPRGTPAKAFLTGDRTQAAAQQQQQNKAIALSDGPMSAATTASGSGGGGTGGGGGCPAIDMYVHPDMMVAHCISGDPLDCVDLAGSPFEAAVRSITLSDQPCVRLVAENGAEVIVSTTTPVPTREVLLAEAEGFPIDELPLFADEIHAGMHVMTDVGNGIEWSRLVETESAGIKTVARLYCGGHNFAAGKEAGKRIFTHNMRLVLK